MWLSPAYGREGYGVLNYNVLHFFPFFFFYLGMDLIGQPGGERFHSNDEISSVSVENLQVSYFTISRILLLGNACLCIFQNLIFPLHTSRAVENQGVNFSSGHPCLQILSAKSIILQIFLFDVLLSDKRCFGRAQIFTN